MKKQLLLAMTALSINASAQIPTAGLVGEYPCNGNANDISGNGNNGTNNGAVLTTDRFGNANSAYSFNGTSSFISIPNVAQLGNAARSIFCWVKFSSTNPTCPISTGSIIANGNSFNLVTNYTDPTQHNLGVMGYYNDFYPANNSTINDNAWHLIGATYDGLGNIKTYVDGVLDNSGTLSFNTAGQINYIGKANAISDENYFDGIIDDILFYSRDLSVSEVLQVFNGASCVIPTAGLVGQYPFNGNANDISGNGNNGTNNGAILTTDRFGNANSAYSFNGASSFISIPNAAQTGNAARSIFCWVKFSSTNPTCPISTGSIIANGNSFNLVTNYTDPTQHNLGVMGYYNDFYPTNNAIVNDNVWHLIGTTYDGAGNIKTYIDGVLDNSGILTFNTVGQINYIGKANAISDENYFDGMIDDVLFYNRELSVGEVTSVYCTSSITTGIYNYADAKSLNVFPNPSTDKIYINNGIEEINIVKLFSIDGKLIQSISFNSAKGEIDITSLSNGIYFVHLIDAQNNTLDIRKIVIQ